MERGSAVAPARTVIVPAYNEEHRLGATVAQILDLADDRTEVIFVDDGSADRTLAVLDEATADHPYARVLASPSNRGKGAAVRLGVASARGRALVFMDADLATDLSALDPLVGALDRHHVAIGSRALEGTVVTGAPAKRTRMGHSFNRLVRLATGVPFADTQCGFKGFQAAIGKLLFALGRVDGFAFDVELLSLAAQLGLDVVEVPVDWHYVDGSHVRPVADALRMSLDVVRARRAKLDAPARVCSARFACEPEHADELRAAILPHVRAADLVVQIDGAVVVLAPFVRPQHMEPLVQRIATITQNHAVEVRDLDAGGVMRLVAGSTGRPSTALADAVNHHGAMAPRDHLEYLIPALDASLI
jgi:dolichyl-phosphate beta-glucosyltransferase